MSETNQLVLQEAAVPAAQAGAATRPDVAEENSETAFSVALAIVEQNGSEIERSCQIMTLEAGAVYRSDDGLKLVTDPRQWAFSAEAVLCLASSGRNARTITVKLSVQEGELGIGWLSADRLRWVDRSSAKAGEGAMSVKFRVPEEEYEGHLVFDNWTPRNKSAVAYLSGVTVVNHPRADYSATVACEQGRIAENNGRLQEAISFYCEALRQNPKHMLARANLGALRFKAPPQPFVDEMRGRVRRETAEVMIEVRNPCNYRCSYCVAAGHNNAPVQSFDLQAIERAYRSIPQKCVVTTLECGGGEPTVHPQFTQLIELAAKFGGVSFPTNNSQRPERWLPQSTARRLKIRSALHPESEEKLDRYVRNARYLIEHGCDFRGMFICHPSRLKELQEYRRYFQEEGIPFTPIAFIGDYQGKPYPYSYSDEEKRAIGIETLSMWGQRIQPHVNRIRNFRSIPCIAGYRSIYIKNDGSLRRCTYDLERVLDEPLTKAEPCGVSYCGCGMLLEKVNPLDTIAFYADWATMSGLSEVDLSWMEPLAHELGYASADDAIAFEMKAMYDALMDSYGKDEFPED